MKNRLYAWLLKLCLRHFIQSGSSEHCKGFPTVYGSLVEIHQEVFTEDNHATMKAYMQGCLQDAIQKR